MLHRKKRESILSWVQSAGGRDVENLKQLSDGIIHYQLIKTLVETSDESPNKVKNKDDESICISHPEEKEQDTNVESNVADFQVPEKNGATNFIQSPKYDLIIDTEEPTSHPLGEISYDENRIKKDSEADIDNFTSDKNENSPCQEIVNGHEDEMIANETVTAVLNSVSETVANLHADAISEISVSETSNSGHTDEIIENAVPKTDAGQLTFGTVDNSDSNTNLYGLTDAIMEQSASRKENFDQMAVENTSDTIISNNGFDCKSMVSEEAVMEVADNVNQNHSCWGLSQTKKDLSTLSNVPDSEISEPKYPNSLDDDNENIGKRYDVIKKFIENMLELESLKLVSYEECRKEVELEIAKVTVLLLSAMVQYSLSVNKEHVMDTCYGLPPEDQEEIMDCLELFLKERESAIEKKEFDQILARTARPRITPVKSTPKITPKKSRSRVRSSSSRKRKKSIILETDSPIQRLIKSPCLRRNTPNSEARLLDALHGKDKVIASLIYDLDTEKYNADDLKKEKEQLNIQLSKSRAEIEKLKSSLKDTQSNLDNQIISNETMKNDLESEIKRYLEQIKELKNDVNFWREKALADDVPTPQSSKCNCIFEISELKNLNHLKEDTIQELTKQKLNVEIQLKKLLAEKGNIVKMDTDSPEEDMSEKEKYLNTLDLTTKTQIQDKCDELQAIINTQKNEINKLDKQVLSNKNDLKTLGVQLCEMEKEKEAAEKRYKSLKNEKALLEQKLETFDKIVFPIIHNLSPDRSNVQQNSKQSIQNASGQALTKRKSLRNQSVSDSEKIGALWTTFSEKPQAPKTHRISIKQKSLKKSSSLEKLSDKEPIKILDNKNIQSKSHDIHSCKKLSKSTTISSLSLSKEEFHDLQQSVIVLCKAIESKHYLKSNAIVHFNSIMTELYNISTINTYLKVLIQCFIFLLNSLPDLSESNKSRQKSETMAENSNSSEAKETAHMVDETVTESDRVDKIVNESKAEDERLVGINQINCSNVIKKGADFDEQALSRLISDLQLQREKLKEELLATVNLLNDEREKAKSSELNLKKSEFQAEIKIRNLEEKLTLSENAKKKYLEKLEKSLAENEEVKEKFSKERFERTIFYLKDDLRFFKSGNLALRSELKNLKEQNKKLQDDLDDEKRNNAGAFIPKVFRSAEKLKYEDAFDDNKEFSSGFCDDEGPRMPSINNISAISSAGVHTGRMLWKEDDEEEMFDHGSVSEIFNDTPRQRETEFRRRNTLFPHHLKSHYPVELNTTQTEEIYLMPPTPMGKPSISRPSVVNYGPVSKKPKMESKFNDFSRPAYVASHGSRSSLRSLPINPGCTENSHISTPKENRSFAVKLLKSQNSLRKKIKMDKHHSRQ